ncbi:hypothetical protein GM658_18360 [Pseudoduganella eburnea]|uniref:Uncharacterized protein n=1 Tax=Massilia eburnea TaxID=1776165 RepID=A0A6L6QLK1_9BURK|nr:hypothetical protein [Massilia eburnea]MTW12576.1 hypothetical protein [Massilia eburnea]
MHLLRIAIQWSLLSVLVCSTSLAASATPKSDKEMLKCESGPINKTFGKTGWLVYGCADGRSIVVVSAPGNPAFPFYFMVSPGENGYDVVGEGTGSKDATSMAFDDLKTHSDAAIKALVAEASDRK